MRGEWRRLGGILHDSEKYGDERMFYTYHNHGMWSGLKHLRFKKKIATRGKICEISKKKLANYLKKVNTQIK